MPPQPQPNHPPPIVGRERELALLRRHLDAALAGRGRLVMVSGEAGIGKTALAEALCREAEQLGALVLVGRCYDLTETPPYGPWIELFGGYRPAGGGPQGGMPPAPAAFSRPGTVGTVDSQDALVRQMLDFFAAVASRRPAVLLLDDLHWADPASLDLLRAVARNLSAHALLLLATYRSDELTRHHPLYPLLPLLVREAGAERFAVAALDDDAVRALARARYRLPDGDADRLVAYLQGRAEGNALFVGELLRALEEGGGLLPNGDGWRLGDLTGMAVPVLLRQVVDARTARLGEETRHLLTVAAVIGQEVPLDVWAAVAAADEEALLGVVERAARVGLLAETPDGAGVRFTHALIREAIYAGEMATRRRRLHRAAAEALAATPTPDPDAVAYHLQQAGDDRAVEWLLRAGERAHGVYAWVTAAARYEAAIALMERRGDPVEESGWLLVAVSRLRRYTDEPGAVRAMEEALALAREAGDDALAAIARFSGGVVSLAAGRWSDAVRELGAAADALEALAPEELARIAARTGLSEAWLRAARGTWITQAATLGPLAEVLAYAERWEAMAEPPRTTSYHGSAYADGWMGLANAHAMTGHPERAERAFGRALETYRAIGHHVLIGLNASYTLRYLALPYRADRPAECERWATTAVDAHRRAAGAWPAGPDANRSPLDFLRGRWDAPSLAQLPAALASRAFVAESGLLAWLARERGEAERAWERVRAKLPGGPATGPGDMDLRDGTELQRVAAALSLDAGETAAAKEWLGAHDRWLAWSGATLGRSEGHALWAQYHRQAGDPTSARDHAERALAHATAPRQPLALLAAHRLLGELDTEAGRYEDAGRHLGASLDLATACEAPFERALTLLAMAALHAATGARDDAARRLAEVRALCEPLGASRALARADALARRLDAAVAAIPAHPAGLSAREVEVLRLVAEGLSNPQVGERLFLSPRTVEQHLRSIFNKTGVPSRAAAARWAAEHGLV